MNIVTDNSKVIADLIKERDELKEFSCQLYSVITQLQKERDELKAHCDFLKECCYMIGNGIKVETSEVNRTPQQSLAEIKAQAIDEAIDEIGFIECAGKIPAIDLFDLKEYVSQLREQGDRE
jgi:two-component SAPR family response regulator